MVGRVGQMARSSGCRNEEGSRRNCLVITKGRATCSLAGKLQSLSSRHGRSRWRISYGLCYTYSRAMAPPDDFKIATRFLCRMPRSRPTPSRSCEAMDRRTNDRLDQQLATPCARFRTLRQDCRSLHAHRYDSESCSGRDGAHQRRGVDLIGHRGLCHIDDC